MQSAFTSLFLLLQLWAFTQSCPDFDRLMREGNQAKDYETAFKKYDAADAVACTEALREQARAKKTELFKRINALRRKAEKAQADTKRAEAAARMSEQHTYMAMQALEEEQQKTLIEKNNALEALRLAQLMSDSAARANDKIRLANESVVMLILMNDLEALGNIALEKDDFDGARTQYAEVVRRIDFVSLKDSSLLRKGALIREKIKNLDAQKAKALAFLAILHQGDSLCQLGPSQFSAAIEQYLYAGTFNWRTPIVCDRLNQAEAEIKNHWPAVQRLHSLEFAKLLGLSAQGLKFCGKQVEAVMRVQQACRHANDDLSFLKDSDLRLVAWRYNQRFTRRTTLHLGVRYQFFQQSDGPMVKVDNRSLEGKPTPSDFTPHFEMDAPKIGMNLSTNVDFSFMYKLDDRWHIGAGVNIRQYIPQNYVAGAFVSHNKQSLTESYLTDKSKYQNAANFYVMAIFGKEVPLRTWFNFRPVIGIIFNGNYRVSWRSLYFWSDNFDLAQENFNYAFSTGHFEGALHSNLQTGECTVFLNYPPMSNSGMDAMFGLRYKLPVFRKARNMGIYWDYYFTYALFKPGRGHSRYNLAEVLNNDLSRNSHGLSASAVSALKAYNSNNFNLDITLDESRRQFLNLFSWNAGVYYRF